MSPVTPTTSGPYPRVLVVEDEFLIRLTLAEALGDEGFEVLEAENADDALPLLRADPAIRLLLTDIQLPGALNGRGLAQKARESMPNLPIIFMSGRPDSSDAPSACCVYIAKPYALVDVCDAARRLVYPAT